MGLTKNQEITYQNVIQREPRPTFFDEAEFSKLSEERFLVTGAGGSIGSRIVSLLATIPGIKFLATDRDESALHSLSLALTKTALFETDSYQLLDIRDQDGIDACLESFRPTTIIHAAALKHLSVLERQPREAVLTNIFGTANMLEAAISHNVRSFVNISTDKAATPSSVLGMSKYIAEIYTSDIRQSKGLRYTNCRFGNVFNSRGSVIETFVSQIQSGSPITLTDEGVTRFFMHVDEAAFLTIKSFLINQSDVHVFDMGRPVPLNAVVQNLQAILGGSSAVLITGLRSGEKLHEILIDDNTTFSETVHPHISAVSLGDIREKHGDLIELVRLRNEKKLTQYLKEINLGI